MKIKFKHQQQAILNSLNNSSPKLQPRPTGYFNEVNENNGVNVKENLNPRKLFQSPKLTPKQPDLDHPLSVELNSFCAEDFSTLWQEDVGPTPSVVQGEHFTAADPQINEDLKNARLATLVKDFDEQLPPLHLGISSASKSIKKMKAPGKLAQLDTSPKKQFRRKFCLFEDLLLLKCIRMNPEESESLCIRMNTERSKSSWEKFSDIFSDIFKDLQIDRSPVMLKNRYYSYIRVDTNRKALRRLLIDLERQFASGLENILPEHVREVINIVEVFRKFIPPVVKENQNSADAAQLGNNHTEHIICE